MAKMLKITPLNEKRTDSSKPSRYININDVFEIGTTTIKTGRIVERREETEVVSFIKVRTSSGYFDTYKVNNGIDYWAEKINEMSSQSNSD